MIRQAFGEAVRGKFKFTETQNAIQVKSKVKSMLIIFFDIKGIALKKIVLAGRPNTQFLLLL
jgi:hypothetical protein